MNKIILSVVLAGVLAACSSAPPKVEEPAKVEEVKVVPEAPKPVAATPPPAVETVAPAQPLEEVKKEEDGGYPPKDQGGALGKRSIFYAFDAFAVADEYKPVAEAHAGFLSHHRKAKVTLQGNCDERGSREYNLALGARRAEGVKNLLSLSGAGSDQIEVVSFGKEKPKAAGHDDEAWAQNRRVDFVYQGE
jgi:peptidoglycan-associated lipoprotein